MNKLVMEVAAHLGLHFQSKQGVNGAMWVRRYVSGHRYWFGKAASVILTTMKLYSVYMLIFAFSLPITI